MNIRLPSIKRITLILLAVFMMLAGIPEAPVHAEGASSGANRFNVVFVLDSSGSLNGTDPDEYRYEAVKQFTDLLTEKGNYIGAVSFSDRAVTTSELGQVNSSGDKDAVVEGLRSVEAEGYTNIGDGLSTANRMLLKKGSRDLASVIVLLSDGNSEMPSDEELQESLELKAEAVDEARKNGIAIYSVCLNANDAADTSEMKQISKATGGQFQEVRNAEDLQDVFNAFYGLIYGTSTVSLADKSFPKSGKLRTKFQVPGLGVEEVNVIIYGKTTNVKLLRPDGSSYKAQMSSSSTFSMLKITDVEAGTWTLITEGIPGDRIRINMVYNSNLLIGVGAEPSGDKITTEDSFRVLATLSTGDELAESSEQYEGYQAQLRLYDAYREQLGTVDMKVSGDHFEAGYPLEEGTYFYDVHVEGNYLEKTSELIGPLTVTRKEEAEEQEETEEVNTPPIPVNETVEKIVYLLPGRGGGFSIDLNGLAEDEQDDRLQYAVVSSSFIEGEDYTVEDDILTQEHFSLSRGGYTIRAIDSGGLSCEIEIGVRTVNVGMLALIGLGILLLLGVMAAGIGFYILLSKPFRGDIFVQSYCNGNYRGVKRSPRRGRCKLSVFGLEAIGLNYNKSYFQASGKNYVTLCTNVPVLHAGQKKKKITIPSGAEVEISMDETNTRKLYIRFDSRLKGTAGRGGAQRPRQARGPQQMRGTRQPRRR